MFVQKSPFPAFEKGGNRKSPFVKGDLEGFSPAQHHFDETLMKWRGSLTAKSAGDSADSQLQKFTGRKDNGQTPSSRDSHPPAGQAG